MFAGGRGPISSRFLAETLRRNEFWTGPREWIDRRLRTSVLDANVVFEDGAYQAIVPITGLNERLGVVVLTYRQPRMDAD